MERDAAEEDDDEGVEVFAMCPVLKARYLGAYRSGWLLILL